MKKLKQCMSFIKRVSILGVLPVLTGCNGGGSSASGSGLGNLFNSTAVVTLPNPNEAENVALSLDPQFQQQVFETTQHTLEMAKVVNPEPTTMLLMGSGVMAMAYFKSLKSTSRSKI